MRECFFHLAHFYYLDAWGGVYALEVVGGDDDGLKSGDRALGRAIGRCAHQRLHLDEERAGAVDGHPDGGAAKRLVVLGQQHLAGVCHLAQASTWLQRDGRRYTPSLIPTRSTSTHTAPS